MQPAIGGHQGELIVDIAVLDDEGLDENPVSGVRKAALKHPGGRGGREGSGMVDKTVASGVGELGGRPELKGKGQGREGEREVPRSVGERGQGGPEG